MKSRITGAAIAAALTVALAVDVRAASKPDPIVSCAKVKKLDETLWLAGQTHVWSGRTAEGSLWHTVRLYTRVSRQTDWTLVAVFRSGIACVFSRGAARPDLLLGERGPGVRDQGSGGK